VLDNFKQGRAKIAEWCGLVAKNTEMELTPISDKFAKIAEIGWKIFEHIDKAVWAPQFETSTAEVLSTKAMEDISAGQKLAFDMLVAFLQIFESVDSLMKKHSGTLLSKLNLVADFAEVTELLEFRFSYTTSVRLFAQLMDVEANSASDLGEKAALTVKAADATADAVKMLQNKVRGQQLEQFKGVALQTVRDRLEAQEKHCRSRMAESFATTLAQWKSQLVPSKIPQWYGTSGAFLPDVAAKDGETALKSVAQMVEPVGYDTVRRMAAQLGKKHHLLCIEFAEKFNKLMLIGSTCALGVCELRVLNASADVDPSSVKDVPADTKLLLSFAKFSQAVNEMKDFYKSSQEPLKALRVAEEGWDQSNKTVMSYVEIGALHDACQEKLSQVGAAFGDYWQSLVKIAVKAFEKCVPDWSEYITQDVLDRDQAQTKLLDNPHRQHATNLITSVTKIVKEVSAMDAKLGTYSIGFDEEWGKLMAALEKGKLTVGVVAGVSLLLKRFPELSEAEARGEKYRDWRKLCTKKKVSLDGKTTVTVLDAIPASLKAAIAAALR
jgi:hypothetical protein